MKPISDILLGNKKFENGKMEGKKTLGEGKGQRGKKQGNGKQKV